MAVHDSWFITILLASLCFMVAIAITYPSSRTVYYLHTSPASWDSARETCSRYGGFLVNVEDVVKLQADIDTLDNVLEWNGAWASLVSSPNVWSGLYKFSDAQGNNDVIWHRCKSFTTASSPNDNIKDDLLASAHYCASIDKKLALHDTACNTKLPYICQIEEGQCWFLPVEDKSFAVQSSSTSTVDLNTCAQTCRNEITQKGEECWGFVAKAGTCELYTSSERHGYILAPARYLQDEEDVTSYLKICAGGEPTTMKPVTNDAPVEPTHENCSLVNGNVADWDQGVCYCDCDQPPYIMDPEYLVLTIDEKVEKIVDELKVDPKETSANYRKLNSAEDDRPSAQSMGALGIAILSVVFGGLVLLDLDILITHAARILCQKNEVKAEEEANKQQ